MYGEVRFIWSPKFAVCRSVLSVNAAGLGVSRIKPKFLERTCVLSEWSSNITMFSVNIRKVEQKESFHCTALAYLAFMNEHKLEIPIEALKYC